MTKEWFKTKYRIMPVYAADSNKQVAVMVEMKYNFIHEFQPMAKTCLDEDGNLIDKPAIFDSVEDATSFITHLTSTM